jgi:hypothetical protein
MTLNLECSYAEFHDLFIIVLNVIMLSVVMLSVKAAKNCLCFGGFTNFLIDYIDGAVSSSTFIVKWAICQDGWFLT